MQTLEQQEITNIIGPCVLCGTLPVFSHAEAVAMLERAARLPACRAVLTAARHRCEVCARAGQNLETQRTRQREIDALIRRSVESGLYTREALTHTFAASEASIEARNPVAWASARAWTKIALRAAQNLWVQGPKGVGKTYLCECIISESLAQGVSAGAISSIELNSLGNDFSADKRLRPFKNVQVLLLDDIDTASWTVKGIDLLRDLLDARYRNRLRTLVSANNTGQRFASRVRDIRHDNPAVGGALMERLLPVEVIEMLGESLRNIKREPGEEG